MDQHQLDFLTGEPLEGELLAVRLARDSMPPEEALRCGIEIGTALAWAHARGMVHGALSPDFILLTANGFHVLQPTPESKPEGPYRSPEQVRGENPDSRSDIFAFGALLYELVGGKKAFGAEGKELDQQILEQSPPALNGKSPIAMAVEGVIAGCLQKDPSARRQRIKNAVIELKLVERGQATAVAKARKAALPPAPPQLPPAGRPARSGLRIWTIGLACALFVTVTAFAAVILLRKSTVPPVYSFKVAPPENATYPGTPAVSPDGRYLTFSAVGPEGQRMLWLRPLDTERATPISGTAGAFAPFWSFDSKQLAFFAGKMLKRVRIADGFVEDICPSDLTGGGGTWNQDDTIVFSPSLSEGLYKVSAKGGKPEPLLKLNPAKAELAFLWPQFLPDNQHFVFFALTDSADSNGVYLGSLKAGESRFLFPSETNAVYSAIADASSTKNGYLLFMRDRSLMAQAFDAAHFRVSGEPVALLDDVGALRSLARAPISVSNTAVLVYQTVGRPTRQMVWVGRDGKQIASVKDPGGWGPPRISPDGTRAVAAKLGPDGKNADLWLLDSSGKTSRFTDFTVHEGSPVWSPDGTRIAFFIYGKAEGNFDLYDKSVVTGKTESLYKSDFPKFPTDWSRDGRYLLFTTSAPGSRADLWAYSFDQKRAGPLLETIFTESYGSLSPDGRWLAYQSDETGRNEIYVQPFDGISSGTKKRWAVSSTGGGIPHWRADGKEMFYLTNTGWMMSVALHPTETSFDFDAPQPLFQTHPIPKTWNLYDASPDGQRFLVNMPLELSDSSSIAVFTSWTEKLKN